MSGLTVTNKCIYTLWGQRALGQQGSELYVYWISRATDKTRTQYTLHRIHRYINLLCANIHFGQFQNHKKTKRATTMWIKAYMIHDESTEKKLIKWKYNSLKKLNVQQILWTHTKKGDSFISRLLKKNENLFLPLIRPTASKYLFLLLSITHVKKINQRTNVYVHNQQWEKCSLLSFGGWYNDNVFFSICFARVPCIRIDWILATARTYHSFRRLLLGKSDYFTRNKQKSISAICFDWVVNNKSHQNKKRNCWSALNSLIICFVLAFVSFVRRGRGKMFVFIYGFTFNWIQLKWLFFVVVVYKYIHH